MSVHPVNLLLVNVMDREPLELEAGAELAPSHSELSEYGGLLLVSSWSESLLLVSSWRESLLLVNGVTWAQWSTSAQWPPG